MDLDLDKLVQQEEIMESLGEDVISVLKGALGAALATQLVLEERELRFSENYQE